MTMPDKAPIRTYKYRLYPTPRQQRILNGMMRNCKLIWNHICADWQYWAVERRQYFFAFSPQDDSKYWRPRLREIYPSVATLPDRIYEYAMQAYAKDHIKYRAAYKTWLRDGADPERKPRPAGFRRRQQHLECDHGRDMELTDVVELHQPNLHWPVGTKGRTTWYIKSSHYDKKWAWVDVKVRAGRGDDTWERIKFDYESADPDNNYRIPPYGRLRSMKVTVDDRGYWHLHVGWQGHKPDITPQPGSVGVDFGLVHALTLSDGRTYDMPDDYLKHDAELRRIERSMDRQQRAANPQNYDENGKIRKGPKRWKKSRRYRQNRKRKRDLHAKLARQRDYIARQIAHELTRDYSIICLEDINDDFMKQNKRLAKKAARTMVAGIKRRIIAKAEQRGCQIILVPPAYTSQTCSHCGHTDKANRRTQADFACTACGHTANADVNAAQEIHKRGLATLLKSTA